MDNKSAKNLFAILQKVAVATLCVCVFYLSTSVLHAQTTEKADWDYPVKLGSDEWRVMPYSEKVEKSQPPKEILERWDTETLFKYCIDYPFNHVTFMFNNPNDGFKRMYDQSTVWQEFIRRKDALRVFIQYFENRPFQRLFEMDSRERTIELHSLFILEKLVSETDFTTHLDSSDKRKLTNTILHNYQGKKEYSYRFRGFLFNASLSALLKILESDQALSSKDEISVAKFREKTGNESFINESMDSAILTQVFNYINE